jgi:hypothetical protein
MRQPIFSPISIGHRETGHCPTPLRPQIHLSSAPDRGRYALAIRKTPEKAMRARCPNSVGQICGPALKQAWCGPRPCAARRASPKTNMMWSKALRCAAPTCGGPPCSRQRVASARLAAFAKANEELGAETITAYVKHVKQNQRRQRLQCGTVGMDAQQQTRKFTPLLKPIPASRLAARVPDDTPAYEKGLHCAGAERAYQSHSAVQAQDGPADTAPPHRGHPRPHCCTFNTSDASPAKCCKSTALACPLPSRNP